MVEIGRPSLISFSLRINYTRSQKLLFSDVAKLETKFNDEYTKPEVTILPLNNVSAIFETVPLTYESEGQILRIFGDCIIFTRFKYSTWKDEKNRLLKKFDEIKRALKIDEITEINLHYIDEFFCDRENFDITENFNLSVNVPEGIKLDYTDFHLGVKLKQDKINNYVLKLRGIKDRSTEKSYLFKLESFYSKKVKLLPTNIDELSKELDSISTCIRDSFKLVLSDKMKKMIEYKE